MERDRTIYRLAWKWNWKKIILAVGFYGMPIAVGFAAIYLLYFKNHRQNARKNRSSKRIKNGVPPGLVNLGNDCFVNSLLQALASLSSFCKWLEQLQSHEDMILLHSLRQILEVLNNKRETSREVFSASDVVESLGAHGWVISSQQQDTHEFFQILMATLDDEIARSKDDQNDRDIKSSELEREQSMISRFFFPQPNKNIELQSPFKGMLANRMTCNECGCKSVRFEACESVSVRIPRYTVPNGLTLENCLAEFIRSEIVHGVNCPDCTKKCNSMTPIKSSFTKQLSFAKIPNCLCLHIQRTYFMSSGNSFKNGQFVRFADILDLHPYRYNTVAYNPSSSMNPSIMGNTSSRFPFSPLLRGGSCDTVPTNTHLSRSLYHLKAVTVHIGDVSNGHFVTYKRAIDNKDKWIYVSDEYAKITTKNSVLSNTAYLLFYEKINDIND